MRNMKDTRRSLNLTQDQLSELAGISQSNLSAIEHGKYKPNKSTREKIEKILGKVDWIETENITLKQTNYFKAERLLKRMVELTLTMEDKQRNEFKRLVFKYFK
jgi:transcriptional regulator with XRE-family HTH domain